MTVDYEKMVRDWFTDNNGVFRGAISVSDLVESLPYLLKRVAHEAKEEQRERDEKIARHHSDEYRYPSRKYGASTKEEDLVAAGHDAAGEQIGDAIRNQSMEDAE